MAASAEFGWLDHPMAEQLLRFNLVLEPLEQVAAFQIALAGISDKCTSNDDSLLGQITISRGLRHASAIALDKLSPQAIWVSNLSDPALPIFMAPEVIYTQLKFYCGLVALSPAIHRIIARDELMVLRRELSEAELKFIGIRACHFASGCSVIPLRHEFIREQAEFIGEQLLYWAAGQASSPVASRANLRFSTDIKSLPAQWPIALKEGQMALNLVRSILEEIDTSWLAHFHSCHLDS